MSRAHAGAGSELKHDPQGFDVTQQLVVARGEIQQFLFDAAHVTQAQHCAPANSTTFRFNRTPGSRGECHHEAAPIAPQDVNGLFHAVRGRGLEPSAECKRAFRQTARCNDGDITDDIRMLRGGRPGHQYLRLRQQECLEPICFGLQSSDLVARIRFNLIRRSPDSKQDDAREQAQTNQG